MSGCRVLVLVLALLLPAAPALAQSQAINGTIEGTITDTSGAVLPGVSVVVLNTDTGAERVVVTNEHGLFRAPLLPLGTYRVKAELEGFKSYEGSGVELTAGSTAVLNVQLEVGSLSEVISVTAAAATVDLSKVDAGRNISEREMKNLPLVSRNPYNFALLQPGVTGTENSEFGVPRFSANGTTLRVNYQVDGNTNTQKDRAGLRLMPMSEIAVREVKVVTSGYAPEFGQTMGLVYNAITPSGTNTLRGDVSYRFRKTSFSAFPFYFAQPKTDENKPADEVNTWTASAGGPVVRDRLHFYGGYERTYRDMQQVITIDPAVAQAVGVPAQPGATPRYQEVQFYLGKLDYQISQSHRASVRYNRFTNGNPYNQGSGGMSALERAVDFIDGMNSTAAQVVSNFGSNKLNELRVQYANRHSERFSNSTSASGVSINITGTINFGAPTSNGEDFQQKIFQVVDNYTLIKGNHSFKTGFDFQHIGDSRAVPTPATYTFPTLDAYLAARSGVNRMGWTTFSQVIGDPEFEMSTRMYSAFIQDDWRVRPNVKVLYGVRYDLYDYPTPIADAPFEYSREFVTDTNNVAPRLGVAWTINEARQTVVRASTGIMYDQPLLAIYEQSFEQNGLPQRTTVNLNPGSPGAPAFPATLNDLPPGLATPPATITAPDPDFRTAYTFQNNVTLETALGRAYAVSIGGVHVKGDGLPVITDINLINPVGRLADGRGVYSSAVNANTRRDPRFNRLNVVQPIGDSEYKAIMLTFARRNPTGVQFDLNYTFGKGTDNAPITGTLSVQGDDGRSDPIDLERDRAVNSFDTRHSFNGSVVAMTAFRRGPRPLQALLSDNQLGLVLQFNSGLPFNVRSNRDLNGDGVNNDRPLFVERNSMYLPARWNVDARFSRFIPIHNSRRVEILGEFKNLFNTVQTSTLDRTIQVDTAGNPLAPIPTDASGFRATGGYEQRKFQLGFKFYF